MISESSPWKTQLLADAGIVARWAARPGVSSRRSLTVERRIMASAYAMRKLDEAMLISSELLAKQVKVRTYPPIRPGFTAFRTLRFDDYFDMYHGVDERLSRRAILNVIIHSLVFVEGLSGKDETYESFLVTSDRGAVKGLYQVQLADFVAVMREVGSDYPSASIRVFDRVTSKWIVWAGHGEPPPQIVNRINRVLAQYGSQPLGQEDR